MWPLEVLPTITLSSLPFHATTAAQTTFAGVCAGMQQGWKGVLDQLDKKLTAVA